MHLQQMNAAHWTRDPWLQTNPFESSISNESSTSVDVQGQAPQSRDPPNKFANGIRIAPSGCHTLYFRNWRTVLKIRHLDEQCYK